MTRAQKVMRLGLSFSRTPILPTVLLALMGFNVLSHRKARTSQSAGAFKKLWTVALLAAAIGGCSGQTVARTPMAPIGMSLAEAREIVGDFERRHAELTPPTPLSEPKSIDDAWEILRSDRLDLFPAGTTYLAGRSDLESRALGAQLELSWGEAQFIIAHLLGTASDELRRAVWQLRSRRAAGALSGEEEQRLQEIGATLVDADRTAEALSQVASEHTARGARGARALLEDYPKDYVGYRLAADYYRMRHDWQKFDEMIAQLEKLRPQSTGLLFLRGAAELQNRGDTSRAIELLNAALEDESAFTRARVHLLLAHRSIGSVHREYSALRSHAPHHQVVVWAGPAIEFAQKVAEADRVERERKVLEREERERTDLEREEREERRREQLVPPR